MLALSLKAQTKAEGKRKKEEASQQTKNSLAIEVNRPYLT
jgi:hypothetical protein